MKFKDLLNESYDEMYRDYSKDIIDSNHLGPWEITYLSGYNRKQKTKRFKTKKQLISFLNKNNGDIDEVNFKKLTTFYQ